MVKKQDFISKYKWQLAIGIIALLLIGMIIGMYNRFIILDQSVNIEWAEVENQYQRQADLIPNLVSTVSSAVTVETRFVTEVTEARSRWQTADTLYNKDVAGGEMNNAITAFMNAVFTAENYPVLQANQQYTGLMDELTGTQNRIAVARGRYIDAIGLYNIAIKRFPANVFAGIFGFTEKEYYKADTAIATPSLGDGALPQ